MWFVLLFPSLWGAPRDNFDCLAILKINILLFWKIVTLTVPPDIINEESSADIAVQEGEDASLTCRATGNPIPRVTWRREDGDVILIRKPGSREIVKGRSNNGGGIKENLFVKRVKVHNCPCEIFISWGKA